MNLRIKRILIIVAVSIVLGASYNYLSSKGIGLFSYDNKKLLTSELRGTSVEPKEIHLNEAYNLYEAGVIFLDAREPEEFAINHIKGAVNIFADDFESYRETLVKIPRDEPVVTYCSGTDCDLSIVLANHLSKAGYKNIFVFFGGWNEWTKAKYPVAK